MNESQKQDIKLPGIAGKLGAEVYQKGNAYICQLSADVHQSVTARGKSLADAVSNWMTKLKAHLRNAAADDPMVIYVKKMFATSEITEGENTKNPWNMNIQDEAKFRITK